MRRTTKRAALLIAGLLACPSAALALNDVVVVPWVAAAPNIPHDSYNGPTTVFKAVARGVVGTVRYQWDFGDGTSSAVSTANKVSHNTFADLHATHTYAEQPSNRLFIATVHACDTSVDGAACDPRQGVSRQYKVQVHAQANRTVRVNKAIDDALWRLHRVWNRRADGRAYTSAGDHWAATAAECQAFTIQGHTLAVPEASDPYVTDVRQCINELASGLNARNITRAQRGQNADLNGNTVGLYTTNNAYRDGMVLMALASAGDGDYRVPLGNASWVQGRTLRELAQDYSEHFYWGQAEAGVGTYSGRYQYRGGWNYNPNSTGGNSGEGSTNQWPVLGIEAAHGNYGVEVPWWVIEDQHNWLDYDQYDGNSNVNGGLGYTYSTQYTNLAKTAAGIAAGAFVGLGATSDLPPGYADGQGMSIRRAWAYIHRYWTTGFNGWYSYHWGSLYAMYGVKKAAYSFSPPISCVSPTTASFYLGAEACRAAGGHPWEVAYNDFFTRSGNCIADLGVNTACRPQAADGTWTDANSNQASHYNNGNDSFATAMVVLILTPQIFEVGPTARASANPQEANPGDLITFDHSGSFHAGAPLNEIVEYRWDWDAADGLWWQDADVDAPVNGYVPFGCLPNVDCVGYVAHCGVDADCRSVQPSHIYADEVAPGEEAQHGVTLQVVDDHETPLTDIDDESVRIRISRFNHAPIARCDATPPGSADEANYTAGRGGVVFLNGTTSYDPDALQPPGICPGTPQDAVAVYEWDTDGDGVFESVGANAVFQVPADAEIGTQFVVTLRVVDDGTWASCFPGSQAALAATQTCVIEVIPNLPPVANAAPDNATVECTSAAGAVVTLDGSGSTDPDQNDVITYGWSPAAGLSDAAAVAPHGQFGLGAHAFTLTVTDTYGESDQDGASFQVVDTTAPTLTCADAAAECAGPAGTAVALQSATTDVCDPAANLSSDAPALFALGTTAVHWQSADASGNASTCTAQVTVTDTTAPALTCANARAECAGALTQVAITGARTDVCDPDAPLTNTAPAAYPLGSTQVLWASTDASGNTGTCAATVAVVDTTAPTVTCEDAATECASPEGTPLAILGAVTDICDGAANLINDAPALFPLGRTQVTWTGTDGSGNASQCVAGVRVVDTTAPELTCPADETVEADAACLGHTALAPTVNDACDAAVRVSDTQRDDYALGNNVVQFAATDASGNVSLCQAAVTVVDRMAPTADAGPDVLDLEASNTCQLSVQLDGTSSTDNCSIVSYTWTEGDVVLGTGPRLSPVLTGVGDHNIDLTVCDAAGNCDTDRVVVSVPRSTMCASVYRAVLGLDEADAVAQNGDACGPPAAHGHLHLDGRYRHNACSTVTSADGAHLRVDGDLFVVPAGGFEAIGNSGSYKYVHAPNGCREWSLTIDTRTFEWHFKALKYDTTPLDPNDGLQIELRLGDQVGREDVPVEAHGQPAREWGYHTDKKTVCPYGGGLCDVCTGSVTHLSLRYDGAPAQVEIREGRRTVLFTGALSTGDVVAVQGTARDGGFANDLEISVDGRAHAQIAARCGDAVEPGATHADFTVISGASATGGLFCGALELTSPPAWPAGSTLTASDVVNGRVILTWTAADDPVGVTGYRLFQDGGLVAGLSGDAGTYTVEGLAPGQSYAFQVQAGDEAGNWSADGPTVVVVVADGTAPYWPEGSALRVPVLGASSAIIEWSPARDDVAVTAYRVFVDGAQVVELTAANRAYLLDDLVSGATYALRIEAGDAAGNWSATGPTHTLITVDELAPGWAPEAEVVAVAGDACGVVLTWDGAFDELGVTRYRVFRDGALVGEVLAPPYVAAGEPGVEHTFRVEAGDAADNWSADGPNVQATAACVCTPGSQAACYEGPAGTQGVGACADGLRTCGADGQGFGACEGQTGPAAETCDGIDNDCDGATDEDQGQSTCGVGACAHTADNCQGGQAVACDPMAGAAAEICDGIDNDCDGAVDEDPVDAGGDCAAGTGACLANGVEVCQGGALVCNAQPGAPSPELCDGIDNDCNGAVDDEPTDDGEPCFDGVGACRVDAVTVCQGGALVCPAQAGAPAAERCDGADNDCDGQTDEALGETTCGVGQCAHTVQNCVAGQPQICNPNEGASAERCDGVDNNCNGAVDELTVDTGDVCTVGQGACERNGSTICEGGQVVCGAVPAQPEFETCNGIDDDCNGLVDDAPVDVGADCQAGVGACQQGGAIVCQGGALVCGAVAGEPQAEACDGLDNDCDGVVDNGFGALTCGVGQCEHSVARCQGGQLQECDPLQGADPEVCDGVDNDCDGSVDEGATDVGQACQTGQGACFAEGSIVCVAGRATCNAQGAAPTAEVCDGLDNDCDGEVDDNPVDAGGTCTYSVGACEDTGPVTCENGRIVCHAVQPQPVDEVCDGLDNDCDGLVDDGFGDVTCGQGVCVHTVPTCVDGVAQPACDPLEGARVETCDGFDDDCDGSVDEGFAVGSECQVGVGVCARFGALGCGADGTAVCDAPAPGQPGEEICNGLDDDCDGQTDEGFAGVGEPCTRGVGACFAEGVTVCGVAGAGVTCGAEIIAPVVETCDGVDNDCDGTIDETPLDAGGDCTAGLGACAADGIVRCVNGATLCDAVEGQPGAEICDGIDNNCDGAVDEGGVCPDETDPEIVLTLQIDVVNPGEILWVQAWATDDRGEATVTVIFNGAPLALDGNGVAEFAAPAEPGAYEVLATATDAAGNTATLTRTLWVLDPNDVTAPVVVIDSPEADTEIDGPIEFAGTVDDDNLYRWEIAARRKSESAWVTLFTGDTAVVDGPLGTVDPTLMAAGIYEIRLLAEDVNGRRASVSKTYEVADGAKPGRVQFAFEDLTVPVSGLPITVVRSYDSLVKTSRDFGTGWSLELRQGRMESNRPEGEGWVVQNAGGFLGLPCGAVTPQVSHTTRIQISDREVFWFTPVPTVTSGFTISGFCQVQVSFAAVRSTVPGRPALEILGSKLAVLHPAGSDIQEDIHLPGVYMPNNVRLHLPDGRKFDMTRSGGTYRMADASGNALTVAANGVRHTTGKDLAIARDAQGRVQRITDPRGGTFTYDYNAAGDLVAVTNRVGQVTRYEYADGHLLTTITDPDGVRVAAMDYEGGRLAGYRNADGEGVDVTRDLGARTQTTTDDDGDQTLTEWDLRGNVVYQRDANGHERRFTYDANDRKTSETDPEGNVKRWTYNALGQLIRIEDELGNVITRTYDAGNRLLTETDANGNTRSMTYDAAGNLASSTNALGEVTSEARNGQGLVTARTFADGTSVGFGYDAFGNVTALTTEDGRVLSRAYNENGKQTGETTTWTGPDGPVEVVMGMGRDAEDRITALTDPMGHVTRYEYDGQGRVVAEVDPEGGRTTYAYGAEGELTRTTFPDGSSTGSTYNADGKPTAMTDELGRTTRYVYDGVGNLVQTIEADGTVHERSYDSSGRLLQVSDGVGAVHVYEYDAAGRAVRVVDNGEETAVAYDARGNRTAMTLPNGGTVRYEYDATGRQTATVYPDGSRNETAYDARGRRTAFTDGAGNVTRFGWDDGGRLVTVTDPAGNQGTFDYDERGDLVAHTDPLGRTTRNTYNAGGQRVRTELPLGQAETLTYDGNGRVTARVDFNGEETRLTYDGRGRIVRADLPGGDQERFTYSPSGKRLTATDARGVTRWAYDAQDRLIERTEPDGSFVRYTYSQGSDITSVTTPAGVVTYGYDDHRRLATVTDPDGGVTRYTYAPGGLKASITYPNGATTAFAHDVVGRITHQLTTDAAGVELAGYAYTYDAAGNRSQVRELPSGRTVDWEYDAAGRLTAERIDDPATGLRTLEYAYDGTGNLIRKADSAAGVTTLEYDANDRLIRNGATTYGYDANGNMTLKDGPAGRRTYTYDSHNRMVAVDDGAQVVAFGYDVDGNLVEKRVDGLVARRFLVDETRPQAQTLVEFDGAGAVATSYVIGADRLSQRQGGTRDYYLHDALWSARGLMDDTGALTDTYTFSAYGEQLDRTGDSVNAYEFAGERFDADAGLTYMRARWYEAETGRFTGRDPHEVEPEMLGTMNRYAYAFGNPVNMVDPSGELAFMAVVGFMWAIMKVIAMLALLAVAAGAYTEAYYLATSGTHISNATAPPGAPRTLCDAIRDLAADEKTYGDPLSYAYKILNPFRGLFPNHADVLQYLANGQVATQKGGGLPGKENFYDPGTGRTYDLQYFETGWAITYQTSRNTGGQSYLGSAATWVWVLIGSATGQNSSYPGTASGDPNFRGSSLGSYVARSYGSISAFADAQCPAPK